MSSFGFINTQGNIITNISTVTDISTEGSGLSDGSVMFTAPPRAAMWVLNRNANQSIVDGIRFIVAVGGGVWVRNMDLGAPGANTIAEWFVDFNNGDNANDGLTLATAVANVDEIQARWGNQIIDGSLTPLVYIHIVGSDTNPHIFNPTMSNFALVIFIGTRINTPGLSGTLTTYQNWDGATKTQCEFSWSSLIGTWTPGQFLALPSLGNVSVVVGRDIGSKTAVSCDAVDLDNFFSTPGAAVAFQGYDLNGLTGKLIMAPCGEGTLIFQDLQLGNDDPVDLHWIEVVGTNSAQVLFGGCKVYGVDNFNINLAGCIGCYVVGWRNYGRDFMQGNIHDSVGGAIYRVHENGVSDIISNILLLGVPSIDQGGVLIIENDCSTYNAFSGWLVRGKLELQGSFWVRNANINGYVLQTFAAGFVLYFDATKVGVVGTPPTNLYKIGATTTSILPAVNALQFTGIVSLV